VEAHLAELPHDPETDNCNVPAFDHAIEWSEPLRVDKKLSNATTWREVNEKDKAAL
jgi:hypothetical protein